MHFPRLVYKCPGPHSKRGHSYAWRGCADAEQWGVLKALGWFASFDEAIGGNHIDASPREELERKARELGLRFHPNIGDAALAERIASKEIG